MTRMSVSPEEHRLLVMAKPRQAILRPGVRGHAFRLAGETTGSARSRARFSEALVLGMVGRGLLTITQCAKALPVWGNPTETYDLPFSCIISRDGETQRSMRLADARYRALNDDAWQGRAAA